MGKKRLPELSETGRRYVDDTIRARLASPGILRYPAKKGNGARVVVAVILALGLIVGMLVLS